MPPLPIDIQLATSKDRPFLVDLYHNLLESLVEFGHDILPTRENAEWLVDNTFLPAAERGEPVLIARHDDQPVGALFWVIPAISLQQSWTQAIGYGVYVDPDWRKQQVGKRLRQHGLAMLKQQGIDYLVGVIHVGNKAAINLADKAHSSHYANFIRTKI